MGMEKTLQKLLFKTEYFELTDWICREREREARDNAVVSSLDG